MGNTDRPPELGALFAGREPDAALESRVVDDFRHRFAPRRRRVTRTARLQWAAGLALFAAGFGTARVLVPATPATGPGEAGARPSFMLLLMEQDDFGADLPPGALATEYAAWARALAATGVAVRGSELGPEREILAPPGGVPGPAGVRRVGGYFVLEASDLAEARRIASTHPHVGHGGWIEVAPLR